MAGLRDVLLGAADALIRPDATEDFSLSIEQNVACRAWSGALQPIGETGESVLRRVYVQGYHIASVRLLVTPIIDGRFRADLTKYAMLPAPESGRFDRFSLVIPIEERQVGFEDVSVAPRGTAFSVYVEIQAPRARAYLTSAVPWLEPVNTAGGPKTT